MPDLIDDVLKKSSYDTPVYELQDAAMLLRCPIWILEHLSSAEPSDLHPKGYLSFPDFCDFYIRLFSIQSILGHHYYLSMPYWNYLDEYKHAKEERPFLFEVALFIQNYLVSSPKIFSKYHKPSDGLKTYQEWLRQPSGVFYRYKSTIDRRLLQCYRRFEINEANVPILLYPFSRYPLEKSPSLISIDARFRSGQATTFKRKIPTNIIAGRFNAGDSIAELARDFGLENHEVEEAVRYESFNPYSLEDED